MHSVREFAFLFKFKFVLPEYIHITENASEALASFLSKKNYTKVFVLIDEHTEEYCLPLVTNALPATSTVIRIQSGESHKNLETCTNVWDIMTKENADRKAVLVNLGGGVITDMGGFCACTYKRGIDFVNIPTTLLSMVDASIGGKLGVDFNGFKNHIGLFKIPNKVIIDPAFLKTLPSEEIRSGFAEVIKHNLIDEGELYQQLKKESIDEIDWLTWIESSLATKNRIVTNDPEEAGERKLLNFGHTIGHAVESFYLDTQFHLRHGEAIAIGMIAEGYLSSLKSNLSQTSLSDLSEYILSVYGWRKIPETDFSSITELTLQDKKNTGQQVNCVLLESLGSAVYDIVINREDVTVALAYYNSFAK